jgi:hypothetical protein
MSNSLNVRYLTRIFHVCFRALEGTPRIACSVLHGGPQCIAPLRITPVLNFTARMQCLVRDVSGQGSEQEVDVPRLMKFVETRALSSLSWVTRTLGPRISFDGSSRTIQRLVSRPAEAYPSRDVSK